MEGDPARVGAGLHLRLRPRALALAAVVGEGERAVEGAVDRRAVHAEHRVQRRVAGDVAAHLVQARPARGAPEG